MAPRQKWQEIIPGAELMTEFWRKIGGCQGYRVSNLGRVSGKRVKILKQITTIQYGYNVVTLYQTQYRVQRLVATAFIPNPQSKPQVNHLNGVKTDNRSCNLEWVTHKENKSHAAKMGLTARGTRNHFSKLNNEAVLEIRTLSSKGLSALRLAKMYGVSRRNIYSIVNRETWKHL